MQIHSLQGCFTRKIFRTPLANPLFIILKALRLVWLNSGPLYTMPFSLHIGLASRSQYLMKISMLHNGIQLISDWPPVYMRTLRWTLQWSPVCLFCIHCPSCAALQMDGRLLELLMRFRPEVIPDLYRIYTGFILESTVYIRSDWFHVILRAFSLKTQRIGVY